MKLRLLVQFLTIGCLLLGINAFAQSKKSQREVLKVLSAQEKAWNEGSIEAFMEGYWHSDSLTFVGKSGVKKGWTTTYEGYKKGYPDKATMGKLTFDILKIETLGSKSVFVIGKWRLVRTAGDVGGCFSLVFRRIKGEWYIISDHTS